jgi:uncharacterized SAM-binding protein YcdF (DUF218 family)
VSFFTISKIAGFFINPLNAIFVLFLIVTLCLCLGKNSIARKLSMFITAIFVSLLFVPVGDILLQPLEKRFSMLNELPEKVDGIILLGGAQQPLLTRHYGQPSINGHAERMTTFLALARRYPNAKLVSSGGSGDILNQDVGEEHTIRLFLKEQSFDPNRVIYESKSRNTYENVIYSKELVSPKKGETWLMIMSAASMPRAMGIFQKFDWTVVPVPCDYQSLPPKFGVSLDLIGQMNKINDALHEWVGLAVYYATDKSASFFPQ